MNRTVAVLGPGAVGSSLAVRLSHAGIRTICVARPETAGIIALTGLVVETRGTMLTARVEVAESLEQPVGLLLVTVKASGLEEALELVDPAAVAEGVVVPLLNGLEHMEVVRRRFPGRVAAGTVSHFQAYRAGRVQVVETIQTPLLTIASDELPGGEVERVVDLLLSAGIEARVGQSEQRILWHKLARIAPVGAAQAASGQPIGELRRDDGWRARLQEAIGETCAVAEADGVALNASAQWSIIDELPEETRTSTARDVAAGRRSELDATLGAVLRAADRLGVETPVLRRLATTAGL